MNTRGARTPRQTRWKALFLALAMLAGLFPAGTAGAADPTVKYLDAVWNEAERTVVYTEKTAAAVKLTPSAYSNTSATQLLEKATYSGHTYQLLQANLTWQQM